MDYRDERDALRARVESLERQLEEARRDARAREAGDPVRVAQIQAQTAEAEALLHRIRGEILALGGASGASPRRSSARVVLVAAALVVLALGAGASGLARCSAATTQTAAVTGDPIPAPP